MNPLDWTGPQFLGFYAMFLVAAFIVAWVWKHALNQPAAAPEPPELDLDPYQTAMLEGPDAAVRGAVVALVHGGSLRCEDDELRVAAPLPGGAMHLERAVYRSVDEQRSSLGGLREDVEGELRRLEKSLRERGFLRTPEQAERYKSQRWLFFLVALGLGVAKVMVGVSRDRPVGYLVGLLFVAFVVGLSLRLFHSRRTRRGERALALLRLRHEALLHSASAEGSAGAMRPRELALAAGLFGVGVLSLVHFPALRDYLMPVSPSTGGGSGGGDSGWSGDSSSSDSSSCGGGDSGGGGGCGGWGGGGGGWRGAPGVGGGGGGGGWKGLPGVGLGWRRQLAHFIDTAGGIGFVEVLAEHLDAQRPLPGPLVRLQERGVPVVLHGVSLGLGSAEPPAPERLSRLARLAERLGAVGVSEPLAFVRAGGVESGHLLPVPRGEAALDILAENVRQAEAALPVPRAREKVGSLFEWPAPAFDEAGLLKGVLERTGALVLLDVANLHANALNLGTDTRAGLEAVPRERLAYVHVAGRLRRPPPYPPPP